MGVSKKQLLANQKAIRKEAEKSKQAKELEQLKQAVPDQSVDVVMQRAALQAFEKENNEMKMAKRSSLPPSGEAHTSKGNAQLQPRPPHRQHSYEPMSPFSQRKHLSSQMKSASLSQEDSTYDRLRLACMGFSKTANLMSPYCRHSHFPVCISFVCSLLSYVMLISQLHSGL